MPSLTYQQATNAADAMQAVRRAVQLEDRASVHDMQGEPMSAGMAWRAAAAEWDRAADLLAPTPARRAMVRDYRTRSRQDARNADAATLESLANAGGAA